ncbi:MAG: hypothetical protein ACR5KV_08200 [Wolbachia sp.]
MQVADTDFHPKGIMQKGAMQVAGTGIHEKDDVIPVSQHWDLIL